LSDDKTVSSKRWLEGTWSEASDEKMRVVTFTGVSSDPRVVGGDESSMVSLARNSLK